MRKVMRVLVIIGLVLVMFSGLLEVLADNVQNDVVVGGNDTFTLGGSTTVNYRIGANSGDDQKGCNCDDGSAATVTINAPDGVTATPGSLEFTACGSPQPVEFTASAAGDYEITVIVSDTGTGTYNTNPAKFTLHVLAPSTPIDTTPPEITASATTADGNAYTAGTWTNQSVTVHFTCSDGDGSGIASCPADITYEEEGTYTAIGTATDKAGNSAVASFGPINIDKTPPTITGSASPGPNAHGWNNTDVTVSFTCGDNLSGVAICPEDVILSGEGANQSVTGEVTDRAGNTASVTVGGINIDKTAPTFGACPEGGPFILGSGIQSVGPIEVNANISGLDAANSKLTGLVDTSSIGTKTITFVATDNAGNSARKTCTYNVIYDFAGFFRPVDNPDTYNKAKAGSAIPIKFSLRGYQGLDILAGAPGVYEIEADPDVEENLIESTVTAGSSGLTYDAVADQYVYVWKTDKNWAGHSYKLVVRLNDGTVHSAYFSFK